MKYLLFFLIIATPVWAGASRYCTSDEIDVGNDSSLDLTGDLTIGMWARFDAGSYSGAEMVYGAYNSGGSFEGFGLSIGTPSASKLGFWSNGGGAWRGSDTALNDDSWHFITATLSSTTVNFYLDGSSDGSGASGYATTFSGNRAICALGDGVNTISSAYVAHVQLFDRILSTDEITQIMNHPGSVTTNLVGYWPLTGDNGTEEDESTNTNDGTVVGATEAFTGPTLPGAVWQ